MNILDVQDPDKIPPCIISGIFTRQWPLMEKYRLIEVKNGFHYPEKCPLDLHDRKDQHLLKDFKWRVVEELAEALEAYYKEETLHFTEELSDALHFMVELCLLSGISSHDILSHKGNNNLGILLTAKCGMGIIDHIDRTIFYLGLSANCLKNKPWKEHHMLTDTKKYKNLVILAFKHLIYTFEESGLEEKDIYSLYFRKNQVNQFRIRSNY